MAVKKTNVEKESRIWEYLKTEHKWENYLFIFLSLALLVLGIFILNGTLQVNKSVPIIGSFHVPFAIIIVVISVISLVYALYPFFKNSYPEVKKVTLPGWALFIGNTVKVLVFLSIFTLVYLMYDVLVSELIHGILNIK